MGISAGLIHALKAAANIAAFLGAEKLVTWIEDKIAHKSGLSQDQILAQFQAKLYQYKAKNESLYNELLNKLAETPSTAIFSNPKAIDAINETKASITKRATQAYQNAAKVDPIIERVSSFGYQPSSYKNSEAGKIDYRDIQKNVEEVLK